MIAMLNYARMRGRKYSNGTNLRKKKGVERKGVVEKGDHLNKKKKKGGAIAAPGGAGLDKNDFKRGKQKQRRNL